MLSIWHLPGGLLFLSILPTLAYPLQKYILKYKDRGREGQRSLTHNDRGRYGRITVKRNEAYLYEICPILFS